MAEMEPAKPTSSDMNSLAMPPVQQKKKLSDVTIDYKVLRTGDFDKNMKALLADLALAEGDYFKKVQTAVETKGYKFVLYDKNDKSIPEEVHKQKGTATAMTFSANKTIYIDLNRIAALGGNNWRHWTIDVIANEGYHAIQDKKHPTFTAVESRREFAEIQPGGKLTKAEKAFREAMVEEATSYAVGRVVAMREKEPDYKLERGRMPDNDLSTFKNLRVNMAYGLAAKMFEGYPEYKPIDPEDPLSRYARTREFVGDEEKFNTSISGFVVNGEMQAAVNKRLQGMGMMKK